MEDEIEQRRRLDGNGKKEVKEEEFSIDKFEKEFESREDNYELAEWARYNLYTLFSEYRKEKELADMYRGLEH